MRVPDTALVPEAEVEAVMKEKVDVAIFVDMSIIEAMALPEDGEEEEEVVVAVVRAEGPVHQTGPPQATAPMKAATTEKVTDISHSQEAAEAEGPGGDSNATNNTGKMKIRSAIKENKENNSIAMANSSSNNNSSNIKTGGADIGAAAGGADEDAIKKKAKVVRQSSIRTRRSTEGTKQLRTATLPQTQQPPPTPEPLHCRQRHRQRRILLLHPMATRAKEAPNHLRLVGQPRKARIDPNICSNKRQPSEGSSFGS